MSLYSNLYGGEAIWAFAQDDKICEASHKGSN